MYEKLTFPFNPEREQVIRQSSVILTKKLLAGQQFMFDLDKVLLKYSSDVPAPTVPGIFEVLHNLESLESFGSTIHLNTARSKHVIDHLRRKYGVQFKGVSILEEGHIQIGPEGKIVSFAPEKFPQFLIDLHKSISGHTFYVPNTGDSVKAWQSVKDTSDKYSFCFGSFQFQGVGRLSFWFKKDGQHDIANQPFVEHVLKTHIEPWRKLHGLKNEHIQLDVHDTGFDGLMFVTISGNLDDGNRVSKATPLANHPHVNFIYVADGENDLEAAQMIKARGGTVVAIGPKMKPDGSAHELYEVADIYLHTPYELYETLKLVTQHVTSIKNASEDFRKHEILPVKYADIVNYIPQREDFSRQSDIHGEAHSTRVLILEGLLTNYLIKNKRVPCLHRQALRITARYHDTQRQHDEDDDQHGWRAAQFYLRKSVYQYKIWNNNDNLAFYLLRFHNTNYLEIPEVNNYPEMGIFMDADALDRIRGNNDLDHQLLRYEESRQLIPIAEALYFLSERHINEQKTGPAQQVNENAAVIKAARELGILET